MKDKEIFKLFRKKAFPSLGQFRNFLKDEYAIDLSPIHLRRILLKYDLSHPISSRGRKLKFRRQVFASVSPDETWWVCSNFCRMYTSIMHILSFTVLDVGFIPPLKPLWSEAVLVAVDSLSSYVWARFIRGRLTSKTAAFPLADIIADSGRSPAIVRVRNLLWCVITDVNIFEIANAYFSSVRLWELPVRNFIFRQTWEKSGPAVSTHY